MTDSSRTREHLEVLADALATPGEGAREADDKPEFPQVWPPPSACDVCRPYPGDPCVCGWPG